MASEAGANPAQAQAAAAAPAPVAAKPTAKKAADPNVKYEVVTVQMKDGTLKRFKRPMKPKTEGNAAKIVEGATAGQAVAKSAAATAAPAKAATVAKEDTKASSSTKAGPAATESDEKESKPTASDSKAHDAKAAMPTATTAATAEAPAASTADKAQALEEQDLYYKHRRRQAFKRALLGGAARVLATDIIDASELMEDDVEISDEDSDLDSDIDNDNNHETHESNDGRDGTSVREASSDNALHNGHSENNTANTGLQLNDAAIGNAAAAAVSTTPKQPIVTIDEKKSDGKETYKYTQKDLNALDAKADANAKEMPLHHRWSAIGFYFMASLSIILPLLFVLLSAFIFAMDGKPLATPEPDIPTQIQSTGWARMPDVLKAAITLWPIVFAAVVAQAFKTWATYRVEGGVSLGELEQLVGANSFAAAAKQPFLLRRLDLLTLAVFLSWCLSPLGSQAIQRVYTVQRSASRNVTTVRYLPALGTNAMLGPGADKKVNSTVYGNWQQMAAALYIATLTPASHIQESKGGKEALPQDVYNHPLPWQIFSYMNMAGYGVPLELPDSSIGFQDPNVTSSSNQLPHEEIQFQMVTSYFNLTCDDWAPTSFGALLNTPNMSFSPSNTLAINFTTSNNTASSPITGINYATMIDEQLLDSTGIDGSKISNGTAYLSIHCGIKQLFVNITVRCAVDTGISTNANSMYSPFDWNCAVNNPEKLVDSEASILQDHQIMPSWRTDLDANLFANLFVGSGSPVIEQSPTTPSKSASCCILLRLCLD
jgi:hypothetical protein